MAVIAEPRQIDLREPKGWRRTSNRIATVLMVTSFVLVIIPLGFVLFTVIAKGASVITSDMNPMSAASHPRPPYSWR